MSNETNLDAVLNTLNTEEGQCKVTFVAMGCDPAPCEVTAGITIGEFALIGAGSVVTKNIPNNTLWIGNPARQKGYVCDCGHKLDEAFHCAQCNSDYNIVNGCIKKQ